MLEELLLKQNGGEGNDGSGGVTAISCHCDQIKKKVQNEGTFANYANVKSIEFIHSRFFTQK